jgi:hypothetical protein
MTPKQSKRAQKKARHRGKKLVNQLFVPQNVKLLPAAS